MLDSVLFARDRYLQPQGLLVPDQAGMWLAAVDENAGYDERLGYWQDVYGFRMSCMRRQVLAEADVCIVPADSIISSAASLYEAQLAQVTVPELEFTAEFQLVISKSATLAVSGIAEKDGGKCVLASGHLLSSSDHLDLPGICKLF